LGVDELKQPFDCQESLVLMVDHSSQIGPEKVMLALGVNAAAMPAPGKALTHEDVRVLAVKPGDSWKTADMEREYKALAARHGTPRAVLVDGAVELREGAECLKKRDADVLVLRDFKHYAANVVKSLIGKDEGFQEVGGKIGSTRSSIQQTELAHLNPPSSKPKARFMNLADTLAWLSLILWLLRHPEAKARQGIREERMQEKLGWVEEYAEKIAVWQECQPRSFRVGDLHQSARSFPRRFGRTTSRDRRETRTRDEPGTGGPIDRLRGGVGGVASQGGAFADEYGDSGIELWVV
jgi:hypothetical protein